MEKGKSERPEYVLPDLLRQKLNERGAEIDASTGFTGVGTGISQDTIASLESIIQNADRYGEPGIMDSRGRTVESLLLDEKATEEERLAFVDTIRDSSFLSPLRALAYSQLMDVLEESPVVHRRAADLWLELSRTKAKLTTFLGQVGVKDAYPDA